MFQLKYLLIEKANKYSLIIRKSQLKSLWVLVRFCLVFFFLYWIAFYYILPKSSIHSFQDLLEQIQQILDNDPKLNDEPWFILLLMYLILAIFSFADFIKEIWVLFHLDTFYFDSLTKSITINKKLKVRFDEVDGLRIRRFPRSKNADEYRLSIITREQKKIKIGQSSNFEEICDVASEIADLIGLPIVHSNFLEADTEDLGDWIETNIKKGDDW